MLINDRTVELFNKYYSNFGTPVKFGDIVTFRFAKDRSGVKYSQPEKIDMARKAAAAHGRKAERDTNGLQYTDEQLRKITSTAPHIITIQEPSGMGKEVGTNRVQETSTSNAGRSEEVQSSDSGLKFSRSPSLADQAKEKLQLERAGAALRANPTVQNAMQALTDTRNDTEWRVIPAPLPENLSIALYLA